MSYWKRADGYAVRISDATVIPPTHYLWAAEIQPYLSSGGKWQEAPPPYTLNSPEHYQAIRSAAWEWMTSVINTRRYDSIESCCSYANSSVARYKSEALAMIAWRDAVNLKLEQLVAVPPSDVTTWSQVKALLPQPEQFNWPQIVILPLEEESPILQ